MQHIAENLLMPGETIAQAAKVHPIVFFWSAFGAIIGLGFVFEQPPLGWVILAFSTFEFLRMGLYYLGTELVLTDQRIISKFGIFNIQVYDIRLERIESLNVRQTLWGRLFNYGMFVSNGMGGIFVQVPWIMKPFDFRRRAMKAIQDLRLVQFVQIVSPDQSLPPSDQQTPSTSESSQSAP